MILKHTFILLALPFFLALSPAPEANLDNHKMPSVTHEAWEILLQKHVSPEGKVNYIGFKKDLVSLDSYLAYLGANPVEKSWSGNEEMAYWINLYNASTIKLILDHYPLSSIMKIQGGKAWDTKWIKSGSKTYSLNNIENDILRPKFKDARIHFAVNCAAKSCPPLLNRAWTLSRVERYFEQQANKFINNPAYNQIAADEIRISQIFEWYAADFGNIIDYLNEYSKVKINSNAKVSYIPYDWALNEY